MNPLILLLLAGAGAAAAVAMGKKGAPAGGAAPQLPPVTPSNVPSATAVQSTAITSPGFVPSKQVARVSVASGVSVPVTMPADLQMMVATAIRVGTPDALSSAVAQMQRRGFTETATQLQTLYKAAVAAQPPPAPPVSIRAVEPATPPAVAKKVDTILTTNSNPADLAQAAALLAQAALPQAAAVVDAKAKEVAAVMETGNALQQVQQVLTAPAQRPAPVVTTLPSAPVAPPPPAPVPQPLPEPKTPMQMKAEELANHLLSLQSRYGMPGAKGKENFTLVKQFQAMAGTSADGKAGPGTMGLMAKYTGRLPLVMYWPRSSTRTRVTKYRNDIYAIANQADAMGDTTRARELRQSAQRERGQAGVIGGMLPA